MKINVISDLHLDFADLTLPGGDVLIISGDLCEAKRVKKDMYNPDMVMLPGERIDHRPDRFYRFLLEECSQKYRHTIYVMGNHEHYGYQLEKSYPHVKEQLPDNVYLLEKEAKEIDGVLFLGATLWTDMNNHDPLTLFHVKSMMSDFRQITMFDQARSAYYKLTPERTVDEHVQTKQYFAQVLDENRQLENPRPVVICTHHSPSFRSVAAEYQHDKLLNGAYHSNLEEFILDNPEIKLWTHGHTHHQYDYMIGDTRIICNPRGYMGYERSAWDFDPSKEFVL